MLLEIDILVYEVFLDCLNDFCIVVVIFVVLEIRLIFNILVLIVILVLLDCLVPEIVMELLIYSLNVSIHLWGVFVIFDLLFSRVLSKRRVILLICLLHHILLEFVVQIV